MNISNIKQIEYELNKLYSPEYRVTENIIVSPEQIKRLIKLLHKIQNNEKEALGDFCRIINDIAPLRSTISKLTNS